MSANVSRTPKRTGVEPARSANRPPTKLIFIRFGWQLTSALVVGETAKSYRAHPRFRNEGGKPYLERPRRFFKRDLGTSVFKDLEQARTVTKAQLVRSMAQDQEHLDYLRQCLAANDTYQPAPV